MWNFFTQTPDPQGSAAIEMPVVVDRDLEYILGGGLFEPLGDRIVREAEVEAALGYA